MDKNLYVAQKFFKDYFGAVCFYNEAEDGFLTFDDGREMQTLAIYFPNRLDLLDETISARLYKAAGDRFYENYTGASGLRLCGINGCKIMASYSVNGSTVAVKSYGAARLKGNIQGVIDCFCGYDFGTVDSVSCDIETNNGFVIKQGMHFKDIADSFLIANNLPAITRQNGYFITPHEDITLTNPPCTIRKPDSFVVRDIIKQYFPESKVDAIAAKRQKDFEKLFDNLTKEEWHAYLRDMQLPEFDRITDVKKENKEN